MSQYSHAARLCIMGEAYFESLIAKYAIPHHIVGQKDVGVDYICEWAYDDNPSGFLFTVQVKTFTVKKGQKVQPVISESDRNKSGLEPYRIPHLKKIGPKTIAYWKGLGLPAYLFAVAHTQRDGLDSDDMQMYYKRYSDVLTRPFPQEDELFYRVDENRRFMAFKNENRSQGFARDLFMDLMRLSYSKGNITWIDPRKLGLNQFQKKDGFFDEFFQLYKPQICETYKNTKKYLDRFCE